MRGFQTEDYCKVLFRYECRKKNISLEMDRFQVFQALQKKQFFFKIFMLSLKFDLKVKKKNHYNIVSKHDSNFEILVDLWFYDFIH